MSQYSLRFLWLEKNIGVALDQKVGKMTIPVTEYYFWPRKDAWEELKVNLDSKPWISPSQNVDLLNQTTEVINFWQESDKKVSLKEARDKFSNCLFAGH